MLRSMSARLDRLESAPRAEVKSVGPDSGLAEAVASVASYRGGRPGGASTFASRSASAAVSAKEQLRSRVKPTPFPPRRSLGLDDDFDEAGDDEEGASVDAAAPNGDDRLAGVLMANIRANYRSALDYVRSIDFSNQRAGHEARRTAQAIDALLREGVPLHFDGMEILVRNLAGVVEADKSADPSVLTGMEWQPPQDIVPRSVLRTVLKDAKRRKELKPKKPTPAPRDPKKNGQQGAGKQ
jgi:hypothetical protein